MATAYVLYNPLAGNNEIKNDLDAFSVVIDDNVVFTDLTEAGMPGRILNQLQEGDYIILCGGDGTLNRFANDIVHMDIKNEILYYPCGTMNDFATEFQREYGSNPFLITEYLTDLPVVTVKGNTYRFLDGIGFDMDISHRPKIDCMSKWRPTGMTVCIDGVEHRFENAWFAATMCGRYCGGMIPAPEQNRGSDTLSLMVIHDSGNLRTAMIFVSLFKGTIMNFEKYVSVYTGRSITMTLDEPRPLRIDGESIQDVITYTASR